MKKELLVLTVAIGMAAALSANGQQDENSEFFGRGNGMGRGYNYDADAVQQFQDERQADRQAEIDAWIEDQELVTVKGTLHLVNGELPYIEENGEKYVISAPLADLENIDLTDGMTVTVEGYEAPGPGLRWDDSETVLMLTKAVVNGEEIVIDHVADGSGYRGGVEMAYGMQGGRGMGQGGPSRGKGGPAAGGMMGRPF
ncbi:MAG: hypothetical protein JXR86_16265 [Spirochaetales bacterium]|nr:hypothetical protein [Spirochaetales bacterium]